MQARHFVNRDVRCLDKTMDSEKSWGGEPTIKAVLLHRRQFRWVRFWESACQRSWRFLQPRIWITVACRWLLKGSTASVREELRGQMEKECSEFNDSGHSKRPWTCPECSEMIWQKGAFMLKMSLILKSTVALPSFARVCVAEQHRKRQKSQRE